MNKEAYKFIIGISDFYKHFPDKNWFYFHEIEEFRWWREYDYEEWKDIFCVDLKMSANEGEDSILLRLKDVSGGDCKCEFSGWISGLDIVNHKYLDRNQEVAYEVLDFEDSQIHFYCKDIEVKVLKVDGNEVL